MKRDQILSVRFPRVVQPGMSKFRIALFVLTLIYAALAASQDQPNTYTYKSINVPGATGTQAFGNNNRGQVVGDYSDSVRAQNGFLDTNGVFTTINCVLENETIATSINNKGEIVGTYYFVGGGGGTHGFIYEGNNSCFDVVVSLKGANGATTNVWGVNDSGEIVGFYKDSAGNYQGFLYVKGKFTSIECQGATQTRPYGIRNDGVIAGDYQDSKGMWHGFLYKSGKCSAPIDYPQATWTSAKSINASGRISGWYIENNQFNGFGKSGGHFSSPLDYPNATETLLFHMNDKGQIVGWYTDASGTHGLLATPKH